MQFDVIIIGGSFAGLSAALQLGRARRTVLVIDAGERRNRFASASHGFLGRDGVAPGEIIAEATSQLARYVTVATLKGIRVKGGTHGGGVLRRDAQRHLPRQAADTCRWRRRYPA